MDRNKRISALKKQLYDNFTDYGNQEIIKVCQELQGLLLTASPDVRSAYRSTEIDVYKFLSESAYIKNDYKECFAYIGMIKSSRLYATEPEENHFHTEVRSLQCLTMQSIHNNDLKIIQELLKTTEDYYSVCHDKLVDNLAEDMRKTLDLLHSYINKTITSTISFLLPYTISIGMNKTIIYTFKEKKVKMVLSWERNKDMNFPFVSDGNEFIYIPYDKFGITGRTRCEIHIHSFFDIHDAINDFLEFCIGAFNYFLQNYKYTSDDFWLDNLCLQHVIVTSALVKSENFVVSNVPFYFPKELRISGELFCIKSEKLRLLEDNLMSGFIPPLWYSLYQDAKGFLVVDKHREAILSINSAFENYLSLFARKKLSETMTKEQIDVFLKGIPTYEDFALKSYLTAEQFQEAVSSGKIQDNPPSTFSIVKKCIKMGYMNISTSHANKLVNVIRKNRNELIHGYNILSNIASDAKCSISAFEEFIAEFK